MVEVVLYKYTSLSSWCKNSTIGVFPYEEAFCRILQNSIEFGKLLKRELGSL